MTRKSLLKKTAVLAAAAVMAFSVFAGGTAFAAGTAAVEDGTAKGGAVQDPVTDPGAKRTSVDLHKFVKADPDAVIPATTFTYAATPLGIGEASVVTDMPALPISDIVSAGTEKTTETGVNYQTSDKHANTIEVGHSTINLSAINWPYAGIYRYYVTETNTNAGDWAYMTDGNTGYELSVYVENGTGTGADGNGYAEGTIGVTYVVVNKATAASASITDANVTSGEKVDASDASDSNANGSGFEFTNTYTPEVSLEISKKITGNAANMKKGFSFTLSDIVLPAVHDLVKDTDGTYHFTATVTDDGNAFTAAAADTVVKAGTDFTFQLGNNDKITIAGLPTGTTYKVTEKGETNYTASYIVTEGGTQLTGVTGTVASDTLSAGTIKSTAAAADTENKDAYTNDYKVNTPTGIIFDHMPAFIAIGAAIVLGIIAFAASRRKKASR